MIFDAIAIFQTTARLIYMMTGFLIIRGFYHASSR